MNKIYDKLLFIVALLAFGAGAGYAGTKFYEVHSKGAKPVAKATNGGENTYKNVSFPDSILPWETWGAPEHAEDEEIPWAYDLFTPSGVQWSRTDAAYQIAGTEPEPEVPFGLRLVAIKHPVYRLVFNSERSVRIADTNKDGKKVVRDEIVPVFEDISAATDAKAKQRATVAQPLPKPPYPCKIEELDIEVRSYNRAAKDLKTGMPTRQAIIYDNKLKREIVLYIGEKYEFTERNDVEVVLDVPPRTRWSWSKVGDSKKIDGVGEYAFRAMDFSKKTITVEKTYEKTVRRKTIQKKQTMTLTASEKTDAVPSAKPATAITTNPPASPVSSTTSTKPN